jgi:hypothetical protein
MDIFKLAFETTVVGLLAFLWIGLAAYLLFPAFVTALIREKIPAYSNQTLLGVIGFAGAYCLGSAILPIANQLVNDEHWPLTESAIRCQVFTRQEQLLENIHYNALPKDRGLSLATLRPIHCSYWAPVFAATQTSEVGEKLIEIAKRVPLFLRLWVGVDEKPEEDDKTLAARCENAQTPARNCDEFRQKRILALFQLEESAVLSQGSDKTEQLRQLHERIVVLRGAVFSGFALFFVCLCAYFARASGDIKAHWMRTGCGILLALGFTVFALLNGYRDLKNGNIFDIPVLESLLAVITIFGVFLVCRGLQNRQFQRKLYLLVGLFFLGLAYGGWMWSEIIYDQEVMSAFAVLQTEVPLRGSERPMLP